jgi:hypothetical protein
MEVLEAELAKKNQVLEKMKAEVGGLDKVACSFACVSIVLGSSTIVLTFISCLSYVIAVYEKGFLFSHKH